MQEQFIGRAAHGPASKHPTLPLWFCRGDMDQRFFVMQVRFNPSLIEPTDGRSLLASEWGGLMQICG